MEVTARLGNKSMKKQAKVHHNTAIEGLHERLEREPVLEDAATIWVHNAQYLFDRDKEKKIEPVATNRQ